MTTGVPLYLVSACASAEEFVAAFRRYTDRSGIFVPLAEPIAQGRRGLIALTLADGGVMIEGDCEIIQSSTKPSGLYGRVGMTLRFVDPDELGKTLLVELEKARLVMTPPKSSITPRPAEIPAAPRPTPPPISGRIDAANALAECVVNGDLTALREPLADPNKSGPGKFVIPTIPNMRGNSPTTPPALTARPKTPSTPPALTPRPKGSTVPPADAAADSVDEGRPEDDLARHAGDGSASREIRSGAQEHDARDAPADEAARGDCGVSERTWRQGADRAMQ